MHNWIVLASEIRPGYWYGGSHLGATYFDDAVSRRMYLHIADHVATWYLDMLRVGKLFSIR